MPDIKAWLTMVASSVKMPRMFDHIAWIHGLDTRHTVWLLVACAYAQLWPIVYFVTLVQWNEQQTILGVDQKDRSLWKREWWLTCIALAFMSDVPRTWNIRLPSLSYVSSSDPARNPAPLPPCEQHKSQVLVFVSWMKYFNTFPLLLFTFLLKIIAKHMRENGIWMEEKAQPRACA